MSRYYICRSQFSKLKKKMKPLRSLMMRQVNEMMAQNKLIWIAFFQTILLLIARQIQNTLSQSFHLNNIRTSVYPPLLYTRVASRTTCDRCWATSTSFYFSWRFELVVTMENNYPMQKSHLHNVFYHNFPCDITHAIIFVNLPQHAH